MLEITFLNNSDDFFNKIPLKHAKQIVSKIEKLSEDINSVPTKNVIGHEPLRRAKSGEYRIIFYADEENLKIYLIDKRNDDTIYKKLNRSSS